MEGSSSARTNGCSLHLVFLLEMKLILLSLMRSARWDITAAVRSIEAASAASDSGGVSADSALASSVVSNGHAKFALESYICRKIFQGFDHETFYMDGSLSSFINPDQYRRDCFAQFKDMKAMDPMELLGILPTCHFGKFCSKKYLSIIHHEMEESLFGDSEQWEMVLAGKHPRSQFYGCFISWPFRSIHPRVTLKQTEEPSFTLSTWGVS